MGGGLAFTSLVSVTFHFTSSCESGLEICWRAGSVFQDLTRPPRTECLLRLRRESGMSQHCHSLCPHGTPFLECPPPLRSCLPAGTWPNAAAGGRVSWDVGPKWDDAGDGEMAKHFCCHVCERSPAPSPACLSRREPVDCSRQLRLGSSGSSQLVWWAPAGPQLMEVTSADFTVTRVCRSVSTAGANIFGPHAMCAGR